MSTELDQLLEPKPTDPQPQGETLEQKVGRVLNENADLARRYQELEVRGDTKFQQALSRPATRPKAFQMIAKAAKAMIPGSPQVEEEEEPLPAAPPRRKGVYAETGGRITAVGPQPINEDRDTKLRQDMHDYLRGKRSGGSVE